MILKNIVIEELTKIASILVEAAAAISVWWNEGDGKEKKEAQGKLDRVVRDTLKSLPVAWFYDKAEFKRPDAKGRWGMATLPGKYKESSFFLGITRTESASTYTFHAGEKISKPIKNRANLEKLFYNFFEVEGKTTEDSLKALKSYLDSIKSDKISPKLNSYMAKYIKHHLKVDIDTLPALDTIYLKINAPESSLKENITLEDKVPPSFTASELESMKKDIVEIIANMPNAPQVVVTPSFGKSYEGKQEGYLLKFHLKVKHT